MRDITSYPVITSRANLKIVDACKLSDKKYRDVSGCFAFEGIKLLYEAARAGLMPQSVFVTEKAFSHFKDTFDVCPFDDRIFIVSDSVYDKLSFETAPQGVFCVLPMPKAQEPDFKRSGCVILADHVGDPGNLGAIVRSADAFDVKCIYVSAGSADLYNPKTVRSCMGSLFRVPIQTECDLVSVIKNLQNNKMPVYAAMLDESARRVREISDLPETGLVIGNEGTGVTAEVRSACDGAVYIPMRQDGPQSLNASVAASLLMWEAYACR